MAGNQSELVLVSPAYLQFFDHMEGKTKKPSTREMLDSWSEN